MTVYIIGARGRLGQAIADEYADSEFFSLDRSIYEDWSQTGAADLVSRYFNQSLNNKAIVFVASGLLDPRLSQEDLLRVNYFLPKNVIDGATKLGMKVVTFGTVMEGILQSKNPYIQSKVKLGDYVRAAAREAKPVIHIQLHTLYGRGQPSPFMFLGQIMTAIQTNQPFKMTSGRQLREYHNLRDEAMAIRQVTNLASPSVLDLSHGKPLSLKTIAESVFQNLGKKDLLQLGGLPEPPEENYKTVLKSTQITQKVIFRDSLPAITQYMQECYSSQDDMV